VCLVADATNMPELMAWADVAVSAGGSTLWELAYMGLPALVLVLADNQLPASRALDAAGIAQWLRAPADLPGALAALLPDQARRQAMSDAARRMVDGRGVARVLEQLEAA
jgi:spore coat polysaccharide biosynthesis predicted glycosyltransferase SpsG